ncbi:MAG TPA: phosphoribosylformylglycinamidine synthase [Steroidobacteraceae bacterium]|nr:phosphoribosylformylglycinamidine synthase [Steroidobacteraceae bacterium]
MLLFAGAPALSAFRIDRLLAALRAVEPSVTGLSVAWLHVVEVARPLDAAQARVLGRLLAAEAGDGAPPPAGQALLVVPRPGTTSPWSTKATDIAQVCGLTAVRRIERGRAVRIAASAPLAAARLAALAPLLHDPMTEAVLAGEDELARLFETHAPRPPGRIALGAAPIEALARANAAMGLALSAPEIEYLAGAFERLGRDPTDVEVMMFAQANSEHCRHKIFNADWSVDGVAAPRSLFGMIRHTHERSPQGVLSAYSDNAAVLEGPVARRFFAPAAGQAYAWHEERVDVLVKVETHNHPTAISPFAGAATGSGGEIRDEGATGRGAKPKAGLTGFTVSNLRIPGFEQPWEADHGRPPRIASALAIMLEGPIGAASFNNEFGRPGILGYFRSFEQEVAGVVRGYHKPIMIAGGLGNVRRQHVAKRPVPAGSPLLLLGGPAMLIGLGGGAASSQGSGAGSEALDFASVQRGNPEMQRRAQEVIDACWAAGEDNPILLIHDVGAGGLSNAVPEVVAAGGGGGRIELGRVPSDEPGMSPLEIWCNEAQERYVLALAPAGLDGFLARCRRERCPVAVIGEATGDGRLVVTHEASGVTVVDMPIDTLLGRPPRMRRDARRRAKPGDGFDGSRIDLADGLERLLRLPAVADKGFLVTIGDRSVGGLISRDPLVGPWQVPVSDVAVTLSALAGHAGEAMAMGERPPVALLDAAASARMAVGEAITNIVAADVRRLGDVKLSANWMAACGDAAEDADLFDAVRAVGMDLCPALGIAIPVGKDSLSMRTTWREGGRERAVVAPLSLVVSAFAPVGDVRRTLTPALDQSQGASVLVLVDLGGGRDRLGGSGLAQVHGRTGDLAPDLDDPARLAAFFAAVRALADQGVLLAYHDRSDGGLAVTLLEMAFAGRAGFEVELGTVASAAGALFSEELGAVLQLRASDAESALAVLAGHGLGSLARVIGRVVPGRRVRIAAGGRTLLDDDRVRLRGIWSETSWRLQRLRDDPACADEEQAARLDEDDPGLRWDLTFDPDQDVAAPMIATGARPRVAILREQGVNSQVEMAAAFDRAGFAAFDLHMTDLIDGGASLDGFQSLVACGGFSYGDVLGAGEGWAKSILFNARVREQFQRWFARDDVLTLGICNGCQMLAALAELIPGAAHWPRFLRNRSEQFEGRLSLVEIRRSPSPFFSGMAGSRLPIAVAHGEGRAVFRDAVAERAAAPLMVLRFVDGRGAAAERYPANPNGSPQGAAGYTSEDGRVTIMMPHPERVFRAAQNSWRPAGAGEDSGWMRIFRNARVWLG